MQQQKRKQAGSKNSLSARVMRELAKSEELKMAGEHEKALEVVQNILMENPACTEAAEEVADNFLSLDNIEAAEKAARHAVSLNPESYIGNFVLGFVASEKEQWPVAVRHFTISNTGQPNNPEILRCLGWALFHEGDQAAGIATLQRALSLRSDDTAILCDLAACYLQTSMFGKSLRLLERAMRIDPTDMRVQELFDVANRLQEAFTKEIKRT